MSTVPMWAQVIVAVLIAAGGLFALVAAWGLARLPDFFMRMHAPSLAYTLGAWCIAGASVLYFSMLGERLPARGWLIPVFLAITVPITTSLLARAGLFRARDAGREDVPPPLG
jgi:multicomponent K+:H+ antiporter subunit G